MKPEKDDDGEDLKDLLLLIAYIWRNSQMGRVYICAGLMVMAGILWLPLDSMEDKFLTLGAYVAVQFFAMSGMGRGK